MRSRKPPTYLRHSCGQAICYVRDPLTDKRRVIYLGPHGSSASYIKFQRVLNGEPIARPGELTVAKLVTLYREHALTYYRLPSGKPSTECRDIELSMRPLLALAGSQPAHAVNVATMRAVRSQFVESGLCRKVANQRIGRVKRLFKWAASESHVPPATSVGVQVLLNLPAGRSAAPEHPAIQPVAVDVIEATLAVMRPKFVRVLEFMRWTGCRPGEIQLIRIEDLRQNGNARYADITGRDKMAYKGRPRRIPIGPKGWAIVESLTAGRVTGLVFAKVGRTGLSRALVRACVRAGVERWHPGQLRHTFATEVRRLFGLDHARACLGHEHADVTQEYALNDLSIAATVVNRIG